MTRKRPGSIHKAMVPKAEWRELTSATTWDMADHLRQTSVNANPQSVVVLRYESGVYRILIREEAK